MPKLIEPLTCVFTHGKLLKTISNNCEVALPSPVRSDEAPPREITEGAGDLLRRWPPGPHCHRAAAAVVVAVRARTGRRLALPQPLVSQHLRILKAAGVVAGERCGREVHYRLVDQHLAHIVLDAVAHAGGTGDRRRGRATRRAAITSCWTASANSARPRNCTTSCAAASEGTSA